jgi:hypothetical protein
MSVAHDLPILALREHLFDPFLRQYYNRWANHEQSAKLSMDLYAKTEKKMEEMQLTSALTWIEVQFMKKAVDEVFRCRMTLKWTYAMAYYCRRGTRRNCSRTIKGSGIRFLGQPAYRD